MADSCVICGRAGTSGRGWRACLKCPDVQLDAEHGKISHIAPRWYCPKCVKALEVRRFLWIFRTPTCGHCGQKLP